MSAHRYKTREEEWRAALAEIGFEVTHVFNHEDERYLWFDAKDKDPSAFHKFLKVTDAWDDGNEAWSSGFTLSEDGKEEADVEYDSERVGISWLCSMINTMR